MSDLSMERGPLAGIRVIDLSRILAGPWATQMLADMGAEVIKIEKPGSGDDTRGWGPPAMPGEDGEPTSDAAYFHCVNRNKKSVVIDIANPEGQQLVRELVATADVLVENFKLGGLKKYQLDYESMKQLNPRLVYCSITGFGQTGPYASRAGYDFMIQGMSGLMSITGEPDGMPVKVGVALADVMTGLNACSAIQAALLARHRTGKGQHIDLSLMDCTVNALANQAMNYLATGESPQRLGNAHPNIVPYQAFATQDGHLILAVGNDGQFQRFCEVSGKPDLASDARFKTNKGRVENRNQLIPEVAAIMASQASSWWIEQLESASVPCGPINTLEEVFNDPHVQSRDMQVTLPHSEGGTVPSVASPLRFSETPVVYRHGPPVLGEHTFEVLEEYLQLSEEQVSKLQENGVIDLADSLALIE
ncbi:MAG: CaiB/BaiF CoA transferase family protein [Endozoicomonas sp.]